MTQDFPAECPFCDFEPEVPQKDKTAPEMEVRNVYRHVEKAHPERLDELPSHPGDR